MVHTLASLLTATALLLHAVLGCCVHHDHAHQAPSAVSCSSSCDSAAPAESHVHHGHAHHSHAHHSPAAQSSVTGGEAPSGCGDQHDPAEPCDEARCQWVGTETLAKVPCAAGDDLAAPAPAALSAGLLLSGHPVASLALPGIPYDIGDSGRARARQQVWRL